ncbi:MAG: motility-associated protein [Verrucomicrobiota bacterium]
MLLICGWCIVLGSVFGGFIYSGGHPSHLVVVGEYLIIAGVALGFVVGACPMHVLQLMVKKMITAVKGSPYTQQAYLDIIKAHYELLMVAREQGVVGIEEHVMAPYQSAIFTKYSSFINNHHAVVFMQDALKPIIDGRLKSDQLKASLMEELDRMYTRGHHPVAILTKMADALPGIGIVAAVLGIIITMGYIAGEKALIGEKVAHALVGTFLGLLISYGFVQPLVAKIEFLNEDEVSYFEVMSHIIISYANGSPPIMAAEVGRRAIPEDRQIGSEELEKMLKSLIQRKAS